MRHVIIGAGGAGTAAAETISANSEDEVIVINREKVLPPYSPAALPYYIEGTVNRNELFIWNWHFIRSSGIEYLMGEGGREG
ncbi:FAD-dependent oxidoreductase [Thermococcus peptonophilus]|uniref:FAD-dependent oxidoreductase n=1 Tax=Thermococcus peptonophilus TaxID=53952 RepID=UPI0006D11479